MESIKVYILVLSSITTMIKRVKATKVGDVFEVKISDTEKKYMQYIASDISQLNSDVVRCLKKNIK